MSFVSPGFPFAGVFFAGLRFARVAFRRRYFSPGGFSPGGFSPGVTFRREAFRPPHFAHLLNSNAFSIAVLFLFFAHAVQRKNKYYT